MEVDLCKRLRSELIVSISDYKSDNYAKFIDKNIEYLELLKQVVHIFLDDCSASDYIYIGSNPCTFNKLSMRVYWREFMERTLIDTDIFCNSTIDILLHNSIIIKALLKILQNNRKIDRIEKFLNNHVDNIIINIVTNYRKNCLNMFIKKFYITESSIHYLVNHCTKRLSSFVLSFLLSNVNKEVKFTCFDIIYKSFKVKTNKLSFIKACMRNKLLCFNYNFIIKYLLDNDYTIFNIYCVNYVPPKVLLDANITEIEVVKVLTKKYKRDLYKCAKYLLYGKYYPILIEFLVYNFRHLDSLTIRLILNNVWVYDELLYIIGSKNMQKLHKYNKNN